MALALRLRRVLAAASTSAPLLRPAISTSAARSLPLAPFAPPPLQRRCLPGGAAGFRSTAPAAAQRGDYSDSTDGCKISADEILFEGCDYNHWLITMEFPDPKPSREEMIETYLQTLAKVVGSYEEAKKRMYAFSTTTYNGFQAVMTEEMSEKFRGLPGVVFILPDSYLYPETKEYGGDKYENGVITPRPPPVQYSKPSRNDRNRNYRGNYQNSPPTQGSFQPYGSQQDRRGYAPQQNYAQAGQDGRSHMGNDYTGRSGHSGPPSSYQSQATQYQGYANPAGQGQGYYNSQEHGNFSQGNHPSAPGTYGQPPRPGTYGQPPKPGTYGQPPKPGTYGQPPISGNYGQSPGSTYPGTYGQPPISGNYGQSPGSTYPGSNQGVSAVNPGYGGNNGQGAGPAYGGDNWQGGSGQYPSRTEGQQESWQGRQ